MPTTISTKEFASWEKQVQRSFLWIKNHQEQFWATVLTIGFVIVGIVFSFHRHFLQQEDAWTQLAQPQALLMQNQIDPAQKALEDWEKRFAKTDANTYALFLKADMLYQKKDFPGAATLYSELAQTGTPELIRPLALSAEGSAEEMAGQFSQAKTTFQHFLDKYPDHFLSASAYLSEARNAELSGNSPEAAALYDRFLILYPKSPWAEDIQKRVQKKA